MGEARNLCVAGLSRHLIDRAADAVELQVRQGEKRQDVAILAGPSKGLARPRRIARHAEVVAAEQAQGMERGAITLAGEIAQAVERRPVPLRRRLVPAPRLVHVARHPGGAAIDGGQRILRLRIALHGLVEEDYLPHRRAALGDAAQPIRCHGMVVRLLGTGGIGGQQNHNAKRQGAAAQPAHQFALRPGLKNRQTSCPNR